MKVLFSVYNISGYLLSELKALSSYAEIVVIETPCNIEKGEMSKTVKWIDRRTLKTIHDIDSKLEGFVPDVFFCGGWFDKLLVRYASKARRKNVKTVLLIDTPWKGTMKQWIHCLISRFSLIPKFNYAWGAGEPQKKYLSRLGFFDKNIKLGYYCADTEKFAPIGEMRIESAKKSNIWPHVMLYIGRYVAVKNMRRMERAFIKASEGTDWKLVCIGGGELWEERTIHPRIEHLGYKQPNEIQEYVKNAGCFVLPSEYEPWGVVVHEAALMGLPMLCSNKIQAATKFLKEGKNGFVFNPLDEEEMACVFKKLMKNSDGDLYQMGRQSFENGISYNLSDWVQRALEFKG